MSERSEESRITTPYDLPLKESVCEHCGQCVGTCPVGALYPAQAAGLKEGDLLVSVDGHGLRGLDLESVLDRLAGPPGTPRRLGVGRETPVEITVELR